MNRLLPITIIAVALLLAACATAPPPAAAPVGEERFLIDPRLGWNRPAAEDLDRRFNAAWARLRAGQYEDARRRFTGIQERNPDYLPALLAQAVIELRENRLDAARNIVRRVQDRAPEFIAARYYEGEIALAQRQLRSAWEIFRALSAAPDAPPAVAERLRQVEGQLFEELYTAAQSAPDLEAVRLLREALELNPAATNARLLLAQKLIALKEHEEARAAIEPLATAAEADRPEVQEALAEIEAGSGRYQDAIVRYERLARRTRDPRHTRRLAEIKEQWNLANMPPQYQAALESPAINRGDLAVLLYWNVAPVRFAQNLSTPPIAIDIAEIPGREEIIRAIAIGLYEVDPVTRRVYPARPVSAAALSRLATRLLLLRGAPCAQNVPIEQALQACGIGDPATAAFPDDPVSGRAAAAVLQQVGAALAR